MSLIKKVQNTNFQHSLFTKGDKIVLAVSGGPDSACLLDIFSKLQKKYNLELIIAHVNYGLRGKDSDEDEKFVRLLAQRYEIEIAVLNALATPPQPSPDYRGERKPPCENELRDIRYAFFEQIRREKKYDLIAAAHTLDDQAETYLMRVLRGAGLLGLSAMKFRSGNLIRPLLHISRRDIIGYLKDNKLAWRVDKTNLENSYLRNKIRNGLIPYLEENYNQKIKSTLFDSAASIAQDHDYLNLAAAKAFKKLSVLEISKLRKLHPAIVRRVILAAISQKKKNLKNIEFAHIEEILKIIKSTKSKSQIATFGRLKVRRRGDTLKITRIT